MYRLAVLSIAFVLALGPNATLLCGRWCPEQTAAAGSAHHCMQDTSTTMAGADFCRNPMLGSVAVVMDGIRRGDFASTANDAIVTPGYLLSESTTHARTGLMPVRAWLLDHSQLATALRI